MKDNPRYRILLTQQQIETIRDSLYRTITDSSTDPDGNPGLKTAAKRAQAVQFSLRKQQDKIDQNKAKALSWRNT